MKREYAVLAMPHALLITLLCTFVTIPWANGAETAQLVRQQYIDLTERSGTYLPAAVNSDMSAIYALFRPEQGPATTIYDLQILRRLSPFGTGYAYDDSDGSGGPLSCDFPTSGISPDRSHLSISPDEKWAVVVTSSGRFGAESWDELAIHGYVIDLEAPDRECRMSKFMEVTAGVSGSSTFSQDSNQLYVNLPNAAWPQGGPVWGRTAGMVRHYQISDQGVWELADIIEEFFDGFPNQNAGFATSFAVSNDTSITAATTAANRIKASEDSPEGRIPLLGYIPEGASRNPNRPGIAVRSGLSFEFFPFPIADENLLHQYELLSNSHTGKRLGISGDGQTIVAIFYDHTADFGVSRNQLFTLQRQADRWVTQTQVLDLISCIRPGAFYNPNIADLALSDDGNRLIILGVSSYADDPKGLCIYTRESGEWQPLDDVSQAVSEHLVSLSTTNRRQVMSDNDLNRVLVQWNSNLAQFDLSWEEEEQEAAGLPIWLLYEASRSDN